MTLQTVLMSSLKRQETSLENVLNRLNTEQQKSEQNEQYVNQQLKVKSQEIDAYKSNVEEQFRAMSGMFNQFMKMASTELDLDIQTTNQKTDHTEYNKLKIELDLSETEAKRLRAENIEINKRLRAFISCQICDEPFDTRKRDFFFLFLMLLSSFNLFENHSKKKRPTMLKTQLLAYNVYKVRHRLAEEEIDKCLYRHLPNLSSHLLCKRH